MNLPLIFLYSTRALTFAMGITILYLLFHYRQKPWKHAHFIIKCLLVFYLSALIQITVIRNWTLFAQFLTRPHTLFSIQLIPFYTIIEAYNLQFGAFIYHVAGNLIWFVPLGILLPLLSTPSYSFKHVSLVAFLLSFSIEVLQWVFATGVSDIDDIILNVLGAMLGFALMNFARKLNLK